MQLDGDIIFNSSIAACIVVVARELVMQFLSDRMQTRASNKRAVAEDLLRYCSSSEAKEFTPPYKKDKEIYLLNSIAGINKDMGYKFKELTALLAYNELADILNEEKEFDYKDKKDVERKIKKLLLELKRISYKLKK